tara:strand:- start:569 stop:1276 length:708 start_codon:yes stop_codon:yes gene_type:complete
MIDFFFKDIETHFFKEYPKEACGILAVQKGKPKWFSCKNIATDNEEFVFDSTEYMKIHKTSDIIGIVHNHPDGTSEASPADIAYCNTLGIPYYIFSYPDMKLNVLEPSKNLTDLYGREYEFGVKDCFEAMRDYLIKQNITIPPRILFEDNWFEKDGLDYFCPEIIKDWGGQEVKIEDIQKNDVITFSVNSAVANHCGVFLGNDIFYHHAENRLSCRENLYPFWAQYIDRVYRYVA